MRQGITKYVKRKGVGAKKRIGNDPGAFKQNRKRKIVGKKNDFGNVKKPKVDMFGEEILETIDDERVV